MGYSMVIHLETMENRHVQWVNQLFLWLFNAMNNHGYSVIYSV